LNILSQILSGVKYNQEEREMEVQLQSILLPGRDVCDEKALYYHRRGDRLDFDGYFNLFYVKKRKAYTHIDNLYLSLRLKGYHSLITVHDREEIDTIKLEPNIEKDYVVKLPYRDYEDGVFWFSLAEEEGISDRTISGWYASQMEEELCQPVTIGIDICTYQREDYIVRNLTKLKSQVMDNQELDVSSHIWVYVVDNGKTLDKCQPIQQIMKDSHERIEILPNKNVGGAGGFTRGMLKVLKEKPNHGFTHVLLMDDDAVVEPDTLVRIYGFLVTRRPEWQDITIGGAMMREDYPHILFCSGEHWGDRDGDVSRLATNLDLRYFSNAVLPYLTETGHEKEWYSGWWCCCYSLNVVKEDNLPIPLFIHHDDIEFGLRNQEKGIVFLNGVGVWHRGFDLNFVGSNNLYYNIRNNLIELALHGTGDVKKAAMKYVLKYITVGLLRLRYQDTILVYRGLLDFLRGPQWLYKKNAEKLNQDIRKMSCKMKPVEEVLKQLSPKDAIEAKEQLKEYEKAFGIDTLKDCWKKDKKAAWFYYLTFNGWALPADKKQIQLLASTDTPFKGFRKQRILLFEPGSRKALFVRRDYREFWKIIAIYIKSVIAFQERFDEACQNYRENINTITNQAAWEEYLKEK